MPDFDNKIFGAPSGKGEKLTAAKVLDTSISKMEEYIINKQEEKAYLSHTREPLGKTYIPGDLKLPSRTLTKDFAFGAKVRDSEAAKESLFPVALHDAAEEEKKEEIYQKSHRSFPPGVQRRDGVVWAITGVDPETTRFGKPLASTEQNPVGKCLNPTIDSKNTSANKTILVSKAVEDYKAYDNYRLGTTRGSLLLDTTKHPNVYGRPSVRSEAGDWGTADCIQGDFIAEDQQPDRDLGKAVSLGYRHQGMAADPNRRFGLPSIRTDVPPRNGESLATYTDYGNGPTANQLLFPGPYAEHGIDTKDFTAVRSPTELRKIFTTIGYQMSDAEFAAIYLQASNVGQITPNGCCCIQEFREVMNEVLAARDAGEEPAWFTEAVDGPQ